MFLADRLGNGRADHCGPCDLAENLVGIGVQLDAGIAESLDRRARGLGWGLNWGLGRRRCGRLRFVLDESLEEEHSVARSEEKERVRRREEEGLEIALEKKSNSACELVILTFRSG